MGEKGRKAVRRYSNILSSSQVKKATRNKRRCKYIQGKFTKKDKLKAAGQ